MKKWGYEWDNIFKIRKIEPYNHLMSFYKIEPHYFIYLNHTTMFTTHKTTTY
jgi:hypothetical protein